MSKLLLWLLLSPLILPVLGFNILTDISCLNSTAFDFIIVGGGTAVS